MQNNVMPKGAMQPLPPLITKVPGYVQDTVDQPESVSKLHVSRDEKKKQEMHEALSTALDQLHIHEAVSTAVGQLKLEEVLARAVEDAVKANTPLPPPVADPNESGEAIRTRRFIQLVYFCLKEFACTFIFFVLNSRIGYNDSMATSLILYVVLVSLAFPFVNTYLFMFLRLGPWLKEEPTIDLWFLRITQIFCTGIFQCLGAVAAAYFRLDLVGRFGYEELKYPSGGAGRFMNKNCTGVWKDFADPYFNALTELDITQCYGGADAFTHTSRIFWTFEEIGAVSLFLIGLIHLMEATPAKALLMRRFWDPDAHTPQGVNTKYIPIPLEFIVPVCILFFGIGKAFPTSHGALPVSLYLFTLDDLMFEKNTLLKGVEEMGFRMLGGFVGTFLAIVYYHIVYIRGNRPGLRTLWDLGPIFKAQPGVSNAQQPKHAIVFKRDSGSVLLNVKSF